ncbi:hypothetical protein J40TS1_53510 [Paenibacillus montaniterrae]|uniref:Cas10/Cmr2 second palm domain-containing protein n=1 Tax=Paenibacillus montaniterrae TaxID=429341 RepID=A0A919YWD0_9BACL|nr:hypothetical protein [Paenibacillus montaniterrae]GIP19709.1 hypothetical protein J40TS1_53510 [Paenibacillus montaniterrae]
MAQQIVAVTIEKVQTFLFEVLQAHIQEHQSNSGTLQDIIQSSNFISRQLYQDIGLEINTKAVETGAFAAQEIKETLLQCSGMCVFSTTLQQSEVEQKLDELFAKYYLKFKGQLLLKYVCFEQEMESGQDKLEAIAKSKKYLKQAKCLNNIIARNQTLLFQFPDSKQSKQKALPGKNTGNQYKPTFTENINALFSDNEADNANHFRIAIIKADLDGMGDLLSGIKEYSTYQKVSRILSDMVCLDFLWKKAEEIREKNSHFKLYPLYIAGDDIFFAVPVAYLIDGVKLCKRILEDINNQIKKLNEINGQLIRMLTLSIGVEFTFNREPIRYYNERVQQQLDIAKAAPALLKENQQKSDSCMKICINGFVLYDSDKDVIKSANERSKINLPSWNHFIGDVTRLKEMMHSGFTAHHFLYGFLEKITDEKIKNNPIKYSNVIFYHLLPHCVANSTQQDRENELILLGVLVSQLFVKEFYKKKNGELGYNKKILIQTEQQKRLESYVRLLLVFSDPRFSPNGSSQLSKQSRTDFSKDHKSRLRGTLFNNPLRFLYEQCLLKFLATSGSGISFSEAKDLRALFVEEQSYRNPNSTQPAKKGTSNKDDVKVYRTLNLSSSMLHRIKRLYRSKAISIDKFAEMIAALNFQSKEEIVELEQLNEQESKAPPRLYFDKPKFKRVMEKSRLWHSDHFDDYLDSLLIFYQLKELSIQYKILYPKSRGSQNNKNNDKNRNKPKGNNSYKRNGQKGVKQWNNKK